MFSRGAKRNSLCVVYIGVDINESGFNRAVIVMNIVPLLSITFGGSS